MEPNWTKIYTTPDNFRANLLVATLKEEDVDAVIINHHDSVYPNLGVCEVYVNNENIIPAQAVIKNFTTNE
jgi:hypothetical protein